MVIISDIDGPGGFNNEVRRPFAVESWLPSYDAVGCIFRATRVMLVHYFRRYATYQDDFNWRLVRQ